MEFLTIGAFAKAARLSPKALRLYDELGLLPPAAIDNVSGYRFYDPSQLDRARLIAWLRRLGMPLARIRAVVGLDDDAAAAEVSAYWQEVLTDTTERGHLADFLVDYLAGRGGATDATAGFGLRYAARTDVGRVRQTNEDVAYAGHRLLVVADGVGGRAGASASAAALAALKPLEAQAIRPPDLETALAEAVADAQQAVREIDDTGDQGEAVTTLTALLWSGSRIAMVHIGDTRAYRLRDEGLVQLTHDHTWVQSRVDDGSMSIEEAARHPRRALLSRALAGSGHRPDFATHDARAGDRYLLCSDGLSTVVEATAMTAVLSRRTSPDDTVGELIELAHDAGAPDNVACVVADVVTL